MIPTHATMRLTPVNAALEVFTWLSGNTAAVWFLPCHATSMRKHEGRGNLPAERV